MIPWDRPKLIMVPWDRLRLLWYLGIGTSYAGANILEPWDRLKFSTISAGFMCNLRRPLQLRVMREMPPVVARGPQNAISDGIKVDSRDPQHYLINARDSIHRFKCMHGGELQFVLCVRMSFCSKGYFRIVWTPCWEASSGCLAGKHCLETLDALLGST